MQKKIAALIFLTFICFGCSTETTQQEIPLITIDNSNIEYLSVLAEPINLKIRKISKSLSYSIGSNFEEFFEMDDGKIILIDRYASEISCVDSLGNVLWKPNPPKPGVDRYANLGVADFVPETNELFIDARSNFTVDVFSTVTGKHLRSERSEDITFLDMASISKGKIIFDITEEDLSGGAVDYVHKRFMYVDSKNQIHQFADIKDKINYGVALLDFKNRFNRVHGKLQHRRPFDNIIYNVDTNYSVEPLLKFNLAKDHKFVEYARQFSKNNIYIALEKDQLPIPFLALYDEQKERLYFSYFQFDHQLFFTCADKNRTIIKPSKFYQIGQTIVRAPKWYNAGKFYQQMFAYEYDYLQEAVRNNVSSEQIKAELEVLKDQYGDVDDIYIISFEVL